MSEYTDMSTNILTRALHESSLDRMLDFTASLFSVGLVNGTIKPSEVKRIQKQINEIRRLRDDLAIMIYMQEMDDPRQMNMFDLERITPDMFGKLGDQQEQEDEL